jgi:hypothetical protein
MAIDYTGTSKKGIYSGIGLLYYGQSYSKPKKKRSDNPFIPNFLEDSKPAKFIGGYAKNLGTDVVGTAAGIPRGLLEVGKAGIHDAGKAVGLANGEYRLDNIGRAIAKDYEYTYRPFIEGDFELFAKRVYEHPLSPILDVLTLFSGGGAAVGKAGKIAAKAGSERGAKLAGLERVKVPEGQSSAEFLIKESVGVRRGRRGTTIHGNAGEVLLPRQRTIRGKKGVEYSPGPVPVNAFKRAVQKQYDNIGEILPDAPIVGGDRRVARLENRLNRSIERRGFVHAGVADKQIRKLEKQVAKGSKPALLAMHYIRSKAEGVDPLKRAEQLEHDANRLENLTKDDVKRLKRRISRFKSRDKAEVQRVHDAFIERGEDPEAVLRESLDFVKAYERPDREAIISKARGTAQALRDLDENGLDDSLVKPVNLILHNLSEQNKVNVDTGIEVNKLSADSPARAVTKTQRAVYGTGADFIPDIDGRFPVSQLAESTPENMRRVEKTAGKKNAAVPSGFRERTGFNTRFGLEAASPRGAVFAAKAGQAFKRGKRSWDTILAASVKSDVSPGRGWMRVDRNALTKLAEAYRKFVDDEAPIIFGDSPQLEQARELASRIMDATDGDMWVPRQLHKRLLAELNPSPRIPLLDSSTGLWRTFTVSALRPAFLVNNIVGQTAMLLVAHSPYKMIKTRFAFRDKYARGAAVEGARGLTGTGQVGALANQTAELLSSSNHWTNRASGWALNKAGSANEKLSRVGQMITDDPFRRIAFMNEIRKPAEALLKERLKSDPSYTFGKAVTELLDDPKVLDRVERKVLDDLVDFEDLSPGEREVVRRFMSPFWSWIKGSSRMTSLYIAENPARASVYSRLGQYGYDQNIKDFGGKVPDFLGGVIPIGKSGGLVTTGVNPFTAPSDLVQQVLYLGGAADDGGDSGPQNPLSAMPPLPKALIGAFTAKDPFTGQQISGTPLERAYSQYVRSFPQAQIYERRKQAGERPASSFLFRPTRLAEYGKYLGLPYRSVNREKALDIGDKQRITGNLNLPARVGEGEVTYIDGKAYYTRRYEPKG